MKKILLIIVLVIGCQVAEAGWYDNNDYCLIYTSAPSADGECYWCLGGGDTPPGNCRQGYAMCLKTPTNLVQIGSSVNGRRCSTEGFCKSCTYQEKWIYMYDGVEGLHYLGGCMCDTWIDAHQYRCTYGYYGTYDYNAGLVCTACPSGPDGKGGGSMPGNNNFITDCSIPDGFYQDTDGEYELTKPCEYTQ